MAYFSENDENANSSGDDNNFPSLKKRRNRKTKEEKEAEKLKAAGLQKLDAFTTKVDRQQFKKDLEKRRQAGAEECKRNYVDSVDFFNNFNLSKPESIVKVREICV